MDNQDHDDDDEEVEIAEGDEDNDDQLFHDIEENVKSVISFFEFIVISYFY